MDPASAIGTTSAVVAFAEVTYKSCSTVNKIYTSGRDLDADALENVTRELKELSVALLEKCPAPQRSPDESAVAPLARQCDNFSKDVFFHLENTMPHFERDTAKRREKLIGSVKSAVKTLCTADRIQRLQASLNNCREQLHLNLMLVQK